MICLTPSAVSLCVSCGDGERALGVLRAGHRDDLVVEQLVGDVHAGRDAGLHGELAGVEEGAVADVLEQVRHVGERGLPDPLAPSPPIWVSPVTALSVRPDIVTMVWQPMPPPAIEPSGTAVERLCGQPLQK